MVGPTLITVGGPALIPVWFYGYSAIVYGISAIISLIVCYFAFKLYRMSSVKMNLFLFFGFLGLGLAFLSLTTASIYTYFYKPYFQDAIGIGLNAMNNDCYNFYYIISTISYFLILLMYLPSKLMKNKFPVLYVPLWYQSFPGFHILSSILVGVIFLINSLNFFKRKSLNSFLVMFSFATILIYHLSLMFIPFSMTFYLAAHTFLVIGFGSLLLMLIRVVRSDRKKV